MENNFLSKLRHNQDHIFKFILVIITILSICYFFPREGKFKYEFQKGKPWLQEDLIAPFDFPIYKSAEEISAEKQVIVSKQKLYFKYSRESVQKYVNLFESNFDEEWENSGLITKIGNKKEFVKLKGSDLLKDLYDKGVIKLDQKIENLPTSTEIILIKGNIAEDRPISSFYNVKQAYEHIQKTLKKENSSSKKFLEPLLEASLGQNITYDDNITQKALKNQLQAVSENRGAIQKDEKIIGQGDLITEEAFEKLSSFKRDFQEKIGNSANYNTVLAGQLILISLLIGILITFLLLFRQDIFSGNDKVGFILFMIVLMVSLASLSTKYEGLNIYILPFCILPVLMRTFYDVRLAIFTHIITSILAGFLAPNSFEFMFIQIVAGITSVFFIVNIRKRSQIFITSVIIFICYSITYLGFSLIQEGSVETVNYQYFGWFGLSSLLTLTTFPLMYVFEKIFNFLSDVTLMELADTNSPLLRKMAETAPGTFQHSLQVANLAEEAASSIGGNPLLIRTGALYHDIGKMKNPAFFIENQSGINPHDELDPMTSSKVIIDHVIHGIELAKKHRLPEEIIDFIRTHHGTTTTGYFYNTYKNQHPEGNIDKEKFSYPGPIPFSKETAILMMSDAVEAASRSLNKPNQDTITNLVESIIDGQTKENQFINADITFKNISTIKKIFIKKLMNIYHVRIEYPK